MSVRPYAPRRIVDWRQRYADSFFTASLFHEDHMKKFPLECHFCGTSMADRYPTDFLFSAYEGGIAVVGNLALICSSCDRARGEKSVLSYYLERVKRKQPVRFSTAEEYMQWLSTYMEPYRKEYPEEYALAEKLSQENHPDKLNALRAYLRRMIDYRWRVTYDPLKLKELAISHVYEREWKKLHLAHAELYFFNHDKIEITAYERRRGSNDPRWLRIAAATAKIQNSAARNLYYETAEELFENIATLGTVRALELWQNKLQITPNKEQKDAIAVALKAAQYAKKKRRFSGILKKIFA